MAAEKLPVPSINKFLEEPGEPVVNFKHWFSQFQRLLIMINAGRSERAQLTSEQKNNYLMLMLGTEGSRIFSANPAVEQIATMGYDTFSRAVREQFSPKISPYKAYNDFFTRVQGSTESVDEYLTVLRLLAVDCQFPDPENQLAIRLVVGCFDPETKRRLLTQEKVDLNTTRNIMLAEEAAKKELSTLSMNPHPQNKIGGVQRQTYPNKKNIPYKGSQQRTGATQMQCKGCGSNTHKFGDPSCKALTVCCNYCKVKGHYERVCFKKKKGMQVQNRSTQMKNCQIFLEDPEDASIQKIQKTLTTKITQRVDVSDGKNWNSVTFEADTGAEPTTMAYSTYSKLFSNLPLRKTMPLYNYDHTVIKGVKGAFLTKIRLNGRAVKGEVHVVPDQHSSVLGKNFLIPLQATVDCSGQQVSSISLQNLQSSFPCLFSDTMGTFPDYEHRIKLREDAVPTITRLRSVPISRKEAVEKEIEKMDAMGIWEPITTSEWVHGMVTVPKEDGGVRITTDLKPLNLHVVPEVHPIPSVKDLFLQMLGAKFFSKLDLRKGFFHIKLAPESRPLTTTVTQKGLRQYTRLPMGLTESSSVFQRLVSQTLAGCSGCCAYIDDIIIFGKTVQEHDENLRKVLQRLQDKDFRLAQEKCEIRKTSIKALGHIISVDGISPDPKNIQPILDCKQPTSKTEVLAFLGMINYYSDFLEDIASIAEPLRTLTRKQQEFKWTETCSTSFNTLKAMAAKTLKVFLFDPQSHTIVTTDASDVGVGAVLSQLQGGREVPIAFASATLNPTQRNYSATEKEAWACVWACEKWEKFLLGRPFQLRTDHSALQSMLTNRTTKRESSKFARWTERLQEFSFTPIYHPGKENKVADALSRLVEKAKELGVKATIQGIRAQIIRDETAKDAVLAKVLDYIQRSWPHNNKMSQDIQYYYKLRNELHEEQGCLIRDPNRVVVPQSVRRDILKEAHKGHPGMVRMKRIIRETYFWPGLDKDIENWVEYCTACQRSAKSMPKDKIQVSMIPTPDEPGAQWGIDITGPFFNDTYIVVMIDYKSKFPEVLVTKVTTSEKIITWMKNQFARYGNPDAVVTDNGPQFISQEFTSFLKDHDIHHYRTAVYNPQENGVVEAFNKYLKHGIQAFHSAGTNWNQGIQNLLFQYRATPRLAGEDSPAKIFLGRNIRMDFQMNRSEPMRHTQEQEKIQKKGRYNVGDKVLSKLPHTRKGISPFSDPKTVTEVLGFWTFRLSDGQKWNARKLKPYRQREDTGYLLEAGGQESPRRSARKTAGFPPQRYGREGI